MRLKNLLANSFLVVSLVGILLFLIFSFYLYSVETKKDLEREKLVLETYLAFELEKEKAIAKQVLKVALQFKDKYDLSEITEKLEKITTKSLNNEVKLFDYLYITNKPPSNFNEVYVKNGDLYIVGIVSMAKINQLVKFLENRGYKVKIDENGNVSVQIVRKNVKFYKTTYLIIFIFFVIIFIITIYLVSSKLAGKILNPIGSLLKILEGNKEERSFYSGITELDVIGKKIKQILENLYKKIEEKNRYLNELKIAKLIQNSFIPPDEDIETSKFSIKCVGINRPAKLVSGDFYCWQETDDYFYFYLGDVSGKGVPASIFTVSCITALDLLLIKQPKLDEVLKFLNTYLLMNNDEMMFLALTIARIDKRKMDKLEIINAGNPAILLRKNGELKIEKLGFQPVLGVFSKLSWKVEEIALEKLSEVYLISDGTIETMNEEKEQFGLNRLKKLLTEINFFEEKSKVVDKIDEFAGKQPKFDDVTILGVKFYGKD